MLISAAQQTDSHVTDIYILFNILFHYGFSQDIECRSALYSRTLPFIRSPCSSLHLLTPNLYSPPPWQPRVHSSCLWVHLAAEFICVIVYGPYKWCHMVFVFLEISMVISRSIHIATSGVISSFYSWVVDPMFFTHSSVDGHLDCFCVSTIVAMNSRWLILCADLTRSWDAQTLDPIQTLWGCF